MVKPHHLQAAACHAAQASASILAYHSALIEDGQLLAADLLRDQLQKAVELQHRLEALAGVAGQ